MVGKPHELFDPGTEEESEQALDELLHLFEEQVQENRSGFVKLDRALFKKAEELAAEL